MKITTSKTYRSFVEFRKSKKRFESIGYECVDAEITKLWRIKIVATYCKEDGSIEDITLI